MSNIVIPIAEFKRDVKPLAKKHRTLRQTIEKLERDLINNPYMGEPYGSGIYKIRVADLIKGKGKSGEFALFITI